MGKHPVKGIELPEKNLFAFKSNSIYCSWITDSGPVRL